MTLKIGGMVVIQAAEDATGWRPEELPEMDAAKTTTGANLRSGPSINMPVVALLKSGVRIVRLGADEGGWAPVAVLGWISGELLQSE